MLTSEEKTFLDILGKYDTVKEALPELKMTGAVAYTKLHRLRKKIARWRIGTNQVLNYRRKNALLDKVLATKTTQEDFE
jgi:hypothetical protein